MLINHPKLLLRKKQELWPEGRTIYRFKNALRRKVTITGKTMFKSGGNQTEPAKEEKKPVFVSSEQNYQETADEHVSDNEERKE